MTPLCELARKHETDKGGQHYRYGGCDSDMCHNYTPVYHALMEGRRNTTTRLFEIGINAGSSLRMWRDYFPNAEICGMDARSECLIWEDRINSVFADQRDVASMLTAMSVLQADTNKFDWIIDDGSHEVLDQIVSMQTLLPFLKPNGAYIVEDLTIDCKPEIVGDRVPPGYKWYAIPAPGGLGVKAQCGCGCGGPEQLLVILHG